GVSLEPLIHGGGQEHGLRAGTENVAFAVAFGTAAQRAAAALEAGEPERLRRLRDRLHDFLREALGDRVMLNGPLRSRLPNTVNVSIDGVRERTCSPRCRGWRLRRARHATAARHTPP